MGTVTPTAELEAAFGVCLRRPAYMVSLSAPSRWEALLWWAHLALLLLTLAADAALAGAFVYSAPAQDRPGYLGLFTLSALLGVLLGATTSKGTR